MVFFLFSSKFAFRSPERKSGNLCFLASICSFFAAILFCAFRSFGWNNLGSTNARRVLTAAEMPAWLRNLPQLKSVQSLDAPLNDSLLMRHWMIRFVSTMIRFLSTSRVRISTTADVKLFQGIVCCVVEIASQHSLCQV